MWVGYVICFKSIDYGRDRGINPLLLSTIIWQSLWCQDHHHITLQKTVSIDLIKKHFGLEVSFPVVTALGKGSESESWLSSRIQGQLLVISW